MNIPTTLELESRTIEEVIAQCEQMSGLDLPREEFEVRIWKHEVTVKNADFYHALLRKGRIRELKRVRGGLFTYIKFPKSIHGSDSWTLDMSLDAERLFYERYGSSYTIHSQ